VEPELTTLFAGGQAALPVLPLSSKLYLAEYPNEPKISEVQYRAFARKTLGAAMNAPQLRGVEVKGKLGVLFSREDLSSGMVGVPAGGILGYSPKSATAIAQHVLLSVTPTKSLSKPDETKPAEATTPTETKPTEPKPAEAKPAEPKPAEAPAAPGAPPIGRRSRRP